MLVVGPHALKVGEELRLPGQPIPEAKDFTNLQAYLNVGQIIEVPDPPEPQKDKHEGARRR